MPIKPPHIHKRRKKFKLSLQLEMVDCGPACLQMIARHYGRQVQLETLREWCHLSRLGVTVQDIVSGAQQLGFEVLPARLDVESLVDKAPLPCILHWKQEHFVVLYKIEKKKDDTIFHLADPGYGRMQINLEQLLKFWHTTDGEGIAILLTPGEAFYQAPPQPPAPSQWGRSLHFVAQQLQPHKKRLLLIALLLALGIFTSWMFPILMQRMVDGGILQQNLHYVLVVLVAQLCLLLGQTTSEWVRGVLLIKLSMLVSVNIITGFLHKIIRLPIRFFDTKLHTDILQRVEDQDKIEFFLSYKLIQTLFSFFSIIFLSILLITYHYLLFTIFAVLSALSVAWVFLFFRRRKFVDYARFSLRSENKSVLYEMITGMPEIKLNNAQDAKITEWSRIQQKLYKLQIKALNLGQYQHIGVLTLTQLKSISITFLSAYWVINGQLSLGTMMSIGYIIGQLNGPIDNLVDFFRSAQDAKFSFDRMDEIQKREDENHGDKIAPPSPVEDGLRLENVSFKYEGSFSPYVLHNINLFIPKGKITAIVGTSGSGKTTLVKLLLNFYVPQQGHIYVDDVDMRHIHSDQWRSTCGVVMQDGYIYSGTLASNIAMSNTGYNHDRMVAACKTACIDEFVNSLPMGYQTKIGKAGIDLSGGQTQRILIARAIYKDPAFLFLDEATSSLDARNERMIMENLDAYFATRTVVVIAHRLSTVKNADQIIVLENGHIVETGNHDALAAAKGYYYSLVKNQLELGN